MENEWMFHTWKHEIWRCGGFTRVILLKSEVRIKAKACMYMCICQVFLHVTSMVLCSCLHLQWLGRIPPAWLQGKSDIHLLCTDYCPDMLHMPQTSCKWATWDGAERVCCGHGVEQCLWMLAGHLVQSLLHSSTSSLPCALSGSSHCVGFSWGRING